jgi:DMSO/TMAO reductase YedYZ molybdopterin-dependent catalytic subunit
MSPMEVHAPRSPAGSTAAARHPLTGAAVGLLTTGVALGVAQLVAGAFGSASSPVIAVGGAVIDAAPTWLREFAIRTFGTNDKPALLIGIGTLLAVAAIVLGIGSLRRPVVGLAGLGAFALIGAAAAVSRPSIGISGAIPSLAGAVAGAVALRRLTRATGLEVAAPAIESRGTGDRHLAADAPRPGTLDRRRFLSAGVVALGLGAVTGAVGQYLVRRSDATASRASVRIPNPADPAGPLPAGTDLGVPGLSPFVTPNKSFYRIDTALLIPAVDATGWSLRVHGMVDHELTFDLPSLLERPLIERDVTLTCVSNEVGGDLIGNARWIGAPLADVLREAGVDPSADQLVSRSADGFTAGTPTAVVMDGRDAMLAVAMNGEPLPLEHGFPVRMIVPGLYGYVSATKWLVDLELTRFDAYDAYWIERGWARRGPIKTESRIDTPRSGALPRADEIAVAGVAWAQHRGISRVEVRVDDGAWQRADLSDEDTSDTWRQWVFRWPATAGRHLLTVRATDGSDVTQPEDQVAPFPDGATGWHTIDVTVT